MSRPRPGRPAASASILSTNRKDSHDFDQNLDP
jgi:hypothetical protein